MGGPVRIPLLEPRIISLGPPPEIHADRVVAEMLRYHVAKRVALARDIKAAITASSDGSPKAQHKMAARIERAGAWRTKLWPGKRGRYTLAILSICGWNPAANAEIGDVAGIPETPWMACCVTLLDGKGGGALKLSTMPLVLVTHHALSRAAQRYDVRTGAQLLHVTEVIFAKALDYLFKEGRSVDEALAQVPAYGVRLTVMQRDVTVTLVLRRDPERDGMLVATTII